MSAIISLRNVKKEFPSDPPVIPLDGVNLDVQPGKIVAITGVSGKGKSTLLNVMGGLLSADSGSIRFRDLELTSASNAQIDEIHKRGIGFVFQSPYLFQALTAQENLALALRTSGCPATSEVIKQALADLGLEDRSDHLPAELSVGQKRRLVLARTLMIDHEVILADEPTNDLDEAWSDIVFEKFRDFVADGNHSVVVVTHDMTYANQADEVYFLEHGELLRR